MVDAELNSISKMKHEIDEKRAFYCFWVSAKK